ncbi:MAG: APC family permease [Bacteroidota bacterium]
MQLPDHQLQRVLHLRDAVGVGLGAIIGAGIFVVTGVAADVAGPAFLVGLIIAGAVACFNGLSSAQLAAVYPQSGGTYEYGYQLLHPFMGFSAGWMFLLSKLSAAGIVAIGFGSYFHQLVPWLSPMIYSIGAIVLLTIANLMGIKKAGISNVIIVLITLVSLVYFIFGGLGSVNTKNFIPFAPAGVLGIAEASAILFFAFTGYARIATLAEEVVAPERTIPRAVVITIFTAIVLYAAVSFVTVGVTGAEAMAGSKSPVQQAAVTISPAMELVITLGAATAMLGVLLSQILGISRMMLAMARRNDLPAFLKRIHPSTSVPHIGILVTSGVIVAITMLGTLDFVVRAAAFTILLYYTITNLAAMRQPPVQHLYSRAVPWLGLMGCLAMSLTLPPIVIITGITLLAVGFAVRWMVKKWD